MRVFFFSRRRLLLTALALVLVAGLSVFLAGCQKELSSEAPSGIPGATDAERTAFLESLGWQTDSTPIETLDLQLPTDLSAAWADYIALQSARDLPFADFAGMEVRRYTYRITNYPTVTKGVQANLYVYNGVIIGGDIIATGKNGFQKDLGFPEVQSNTPAA